MKAPDFTLSDQHGTEHTLSSYRGSWVILYTYPKDDTPVCTQEACAFRDALPTYRDRNIVIFGISKDTVASHKKFADKHELTFPLLSDPSAQTLQAYKAWGKKKFMGREFEGILRHTFLIDPEGSIVQTYTKINPVTQPQEILDYISAH